MSSHEGVCISGKAGAGKDRFAAILCDKLAEREYWMRKVAFGDALKLEVLEQYGLTKSDPGGREALVSHGHGMRSAQPDYWISKLRDTCRDIGVFGFHPVVTDTRYVNELDWCREVGFVTVRVDSFPMDRAAVLYARGEDGQFAFTDHPSETELDDADFDFRFLNPHGDGTKALHHYAVHVADAFSNRPAR